MSPTATTATTSDERVRGGGADGTLDDPERVAQLLPVERIEGDVEHRPIPGIDPGEHERGDDRDREADGGDGRAGGQGMRKSRNSTRIDSAGSPMSAAGAAVRERSGHERHHDEEEDRDHERDPVARSGASTRLNPFHRCLVSLPAAPPEASIGSGYEHDCKQPARPVGPADPQRDRPARDRRDPPVPRLRRRRRHPRRVLRPERDRRCRAGDRDARAARAAPESRHRPQPALRHREPRGARCSPSPSGCSASPRRGTSPSYRRRSSSMPSAS